MSKDKQHTNYEEGDNPYGPDGIRESSPLNNRAPIQFEVGQGDGSSPYTGTDTPDQWVDSFIKSRGYYPEKRGFWLDGKTGVIRATEFKAGDLRISGDDGIWFGEDIEGSPFRIRPDGGMETNDLEQFRTWKAGETLTKGKFVFIDDHATAWFAGADHENTVSRLAGMVTDEKVYAGDPVRVVFTDISEIDGSTSATITDNNLVGAALYLAGSQYSTAQLSAGGANWGAGNQTQLAQIFEVPNDQPLIDVQLIVAPYGSGPDTDGVQMTLQGVSGGQPTGDIFATAHLELNADFSVGATVKSFSFAGTPYTLTAGVPYALVLEVDSANWIVDGLVVYGTTPSAYADGSVQVSFNGGSTWGTPTTQGDFYFKIFRPAGQISDAPGTVTKKIGVALTEDLLFLQIS